MRRKWQESVAQCERIIEGTNHALRDDIGLIKAELHKFTNAHPERFNATIGGVMTWSPQKNASDLAVSADKRLDIIEAWLKEQGYVLKPELNEKPKWVQASDHETHKKVQEECLKEYPKLCVVCGEECSNTGYYYVGCEWRFVHPDCFNTILDSYQKKGKK